MRKTFLAVVALSSLTACGRGNLDAATSDSARNLDLLPVDTVAAFNDRPAGSTPESRSLPTGARVDGTWGRSITSRTNNAGETVTVTVTADAKDERGRVVIPRGATIVVLITELAPATRSSDADGKIALSATSMMIRGRTYALNGTVSVPHSLKGRGIGTAEVVKVGAGAAVGATVGQVIGRDTKATVIGAAVGAASGAAVATQTASRDVVVSAGSRVVITLTGPFSVAGS
jgi:hypothetical protein